MKTQKLQCISAFPVETIMTVTTAEKVNKNKYEKEAKTATERLQAQHEQERTQEDESKTNYSNAAGKENRCASLLLVISQK